MLQQEITKKEKSLESIRILTPFIQPQISSVWKKIEAEGIWVSAQNCRAKWQSRKRWVRDSKLFSQTTQEVSIDICLRFSSLLVGNVSLYLEPLNPNQNSNFDIPHEKMIQADWQSDQILISMPNDKQNEQCTCHIVRSARQLNQLYPCWPRGFLKFLLYHLARTDSWE